MSSLASLAMPSFAPLARADEATDRARAHFEQAVHRFDKKDYEGALVEFRAAYDEKKSPAILRNIALCLRALGRNAEAVDTLEQMLHDGGDTLKPEVRNAARRAIDELTPQIGTVRIRTTLRDPPGTPPARVDVTIDGHVVPPERLATPVRVDPGSHTFAAHAAGHADASLQIRVAPGARELLVGLDLAPGSLNGRLRVTHVSPRATVAVDGVTLATGEWDGEITPGPHKIEITEPGAAPWSRDVVARAGETTTVEPEGAAHDEDAAGSSPSGAKKRRDVPRLFYMSFGPSIHAGTLTLAPGPFAERAPTTRGVLGGGVLAKVGHHFGSLVSLELGLGIGASKPSYTTNGGAKADWAATYLDLGPAVRFQSPGRVLRGFGAAGLALEVTSVNGNVKDLAGNAYHLKGAGLSGAFTLEGGASFALGPHFFFDLGPFVTLYGSGAAKEDSTKARFFLDSPAARLGVRAQVGIDL